MHREWYRGKTRRPEEDQVTGRGPGDQDDDIINTREERQSQSEA